MNEFQRIHRNLTVFTVHYKPHETLVWSCCKSQVTLKVQEYELIPSNCEEHGRTGQQPWQEWYLD